MTTSKVTTCPFPTGEQCWEWPELQNFLRRLGVEFPLRDMTIDMDCESPVRIIYDDGPKSYSIEGWECWSWDELKQFMKRVGLVWDLPTTAVSIEIKADNVVRIVHHYYGMDMKKIKEY